MRSYTCSGCLDNRGNRRNHVIAAAVALLASSMTTTLAHAFEFSRTPLDAAARHWIGGHFPPGTLVEGIDTAAWTGREASGNDTFTIVRVASVASCRRDRQGGPEVCSTVIVDQDGRRLFSGDTCGQASSWTFGPDGRSFTACGERHALARQDR